jgi:hypothetical protein
MNLSNPYVPLTNYLMGEARAKSAGIVECIRHIFRQVALDPSAPSVFGYQLRSMNNALGSSVNRFLIGWPVRALAMLGAGWAAYKIPGLSPLTAAAVGATGFVALQAAINQITINFAKMTVNIAPLYGGQLPLLAPGSGTLLPGYAFGFLGLSYAGQDLSHRAISQNASLIQRADETLVEGIRNNDPTLIRQGMDLHLAILRQVGVTVPEEMAKLLAGPATSEAGRRFLALSSQMGAPLSTQVGHGIDWTLNLMYSITSTALSAPWTSRLMDPTVSFREQLLMLFGAASSLLLVHPIMKAAPLATSWASKQAMEFMNNPSEKMKRCWGALTSGGSQ